MSKKKYLLGIDLGTNSCGFCLCNENSHIIKKNGKNLWGVRLFEEASTAADRRSFRASRRRLARRNQRIKLLQELFAEEIYKADPNFYKKLQFAQIHKEDAIKNNIEFDYASTLFNDPSFTDKEYFEKYPTIYHLRKDLIEKDEKADIRLVYLAIAHLMKHRGNFLYDNLNANSNFNSQEEVTKALLKIVKEFDLKIESNELDSFISQYNLRKGKDDKKFFLKNTFFKTEDKSFNSKDKNLFNKVYIPLLAGTEITFNDILKNINEKLELSYDEDDIEEDVKKKKLGLGNESFELDLEELYSKFNNDDFEKCFDLIKECKKIYDNLIVSRILKDNPYICYAMVNKFNEHKNQLAELKKYVKDNCEDKYNFIFRKYVSGKQTSDKENKGSEINNYPKYIGSNLNGGKKDRFSKCSIDDFYKFLKKELNINEKSEGDLKKIYDLMEEKNFLVKQRTTSNSLFPYQLVEKELKCILEKQAQYYPFLNEIKDGLSTKDKIIKLLTFRVPYYVGPLNQNGDEKFRKNSWAIYNQGEEKSRIYPWNFEQIVNLDKSQLIFIDRMRNKCSYLHSEDCLPKHSPLIEYFNVLNELNKLKINDQLITSEMKFDLLKNLYLTKKKVTGASIKNYLKSKYDFNDVSFKYVNSEKEFEFRSSLSTFVELNNIFNFTEEEKLKYLTLGELKHNDIDMEDVVCAITIYEDKKGLVKYLCNKYHFDEKSEIITKIKQLNLSDWSRLSKKLLVELKPIDKNGVVLEEEHSIIYHLINSNNTFMELLKEGTDVSFKDAIDLYNRNNSDDFDPKKVDETEEEYQERFIKYYVDKLYVSPGMKRPLIQAFKITKELEKIVKAPIDEFYIECNRENSADKKTKDSRKKQLLNLYKDAKEITVELNKLDESEFRSDLIYLYFTQMGRDIYTGEKIDLDDLRSGKHNYDIDHIYPQAKIKDDSINNRVLTRKDNNIKKQDEYPIPYNRFTNCDLKNVREFQKQLLDKKLITQEKYDRLTRKTELSDDEIYNFVSRQIVFTSQSEKALKDVLLISNKDNNPKVVMSKAGVISDFRKEYDLLKSRDANNLHHAHDAFLNVVVGRMVDTYFGNVFRRMHDGTFNHKQTTNISKIFSNYDNKDKENVYDSDGNLVWKYENNETLNYIGKEIYTNHNMLITTRTYYGTQLFSKVSLKPANQLNKTALSMKNSIKINKPDLTDYSKYGGYSDLSFNKYMLVKGYDKKNKEKILLVTYPSIYENDPEKKSDYIKVLYSISKYDILIENLMINTVFEIGESKFCVTGKTSKQYGIKNIKECFYSKEMIDTIRKVSKTKDILVRNKAIEKGKVKEDYIKNNNKLFRNDYTEFIISPAKNKETKEITITKDELMKLYDEIINKLKMNMYKEYSISNLDKKESALNILINKREDANNLFILDLVNLISECLKFTATNKEDSDLSLIGGGKLGDLKISSDFTNKPFKIIYESVTGFYSKVVYENKIDK